MDKGLICALPRGYFLPQECGKCGRHADDHPVYEKGCKPMSDKERIAKLEAELVEARALIDRTASHQAWCVIKHHVELLPQDLRGEMAIYLSSTNGGRLNAN